MVTLHLCVNDKEFRGKRAIMTKFHWVYLAFPLPMCSHNAVSSLSRYTDNKHHLASLGIVAGVLPSGVIPSEAGTSIKVAQSSIKSSKQNSH